MPGHSVVQIEGSADPPGRGFRRAVRQRSPFCRSAGCSIRMMGAEGLKQASQNAILNANYIATRLKDAYPVLYTPVAMVA
ncbi:hypothetical protein LNP74_07330 [Klebsiella pneumoniae subsp. pneumoniae]|nr:hypothetical protein [Klebsiella pneumoniae subsp. pneumoniae]